MVSRKFIYMYLSEIHSLLLAVVNGERTSGGILPIKRQPNKILKHTRTIRRRIVWVFFTILWGGRLKC